ncbi:MAG: response regulator, partial [Verrucomicrobiota bacterium]
KNSKVLVVDDILSNRLLLTTVLKGLKVDPCEAVDGSQAIEKWRSGRHQLILMDKRMPKVDGYEAARQIKAEAEEQGVTAPTIFAVSADALTDLTAVENAKDFIDGFIAKPFDIREVRKNIESTLLDLSEQEDPVALSA